MWFRPSHLSYRWSCRWDPSLLLSPLVCCQSCGRPPLRKNKELKSGLMQLPQKPLCDHSLRRESLEIMSRPQQQDQTAMSRLPSEPAALTMIPCPCANQLVENTTQKGHTWEDDECFLEIFPWSSPDIRALGEQIKAFERNPVWLCLPVAHPCLFSPAPQPLLPTLRHITFTFLSPELQGFFFCLRDLFPDPIPLLLTSSCSVTF